jgi:tetratricopeptide (TPR) repeat protein
MESLAELLQRYEELLKADQNLFELLKLRDTLAKFVRELEAVTTDELNSIRKYDKRLVRIVSGVKDHSDLEDWRSLIKPPEENWWWYGETTVSPFWNIAAVFLLTVSVTLLADFTHRLFNSDPDELGILAIAIQAVFTLAASSTFTATGTKLFFSVLRRLGAKTYLHPAWRFGATALLFAVVWSAWKWGPDRLAVIYNNRAFHADDNHQDQEALRLYTRALALNPALPQGHYNFGVFYEKSYRYDKAGMEYQQAIVTDFRHAKAYSGLARLSMLDAKPLTGLRIADEGIVFAAPNTSPLTFAALYKNRAWAEYQLGFYQDAETDALTSLHSQKDYAPAYCVLGRTLEKLNRASEAKTAWKAFGRIEKQNATNTEPPAVEPDCIRFAERNTNVEK